MTRDDERRAKYIGQIIAQGDGMSNPAAGQSTEDSFEANAQAHADVARGAHRQGIPTDSSWFARILEAFRI